MFLKKEKERKKREKKTKRASSCSCIVWPDHFVQYPALAEVVLGHSLTGTADDH